MTERPEARPSGVSTDGSTDSAEAKLQAAGRRLLELESEMARRLQQHASEQEERRAELDALRSDLERGRVDNDLLRTETEALLGRIGDLEREVDQLKEEVDHRTAALRTLLNSRSWRFTRVIREARWLVAPPPRGEQEDLDRLAAEAGVSPRRDRRRG